PGAVYNVGSGVQTSIGEIVEIVRDLFGIDAEPEWGSAEARDWDTSTWVSDSRKISKALGWKPRIALREGLAEIRDWLREAPALWERYGVAAAPAAGER
ncbi:MAG: hypothetical protein ACRDKV_04205, partial [Solirubrobacterales bacterium]